MIITLVALAFFTIVFFAKAVRIIQQSEEMIVERLGRYNDTLKAGIRSLQQQMAFSPRAFPTRKE